MSASTHERVPHFRITTSKPCSKWGGVTNGSLIALAQKIFEVFVTLDRNLEYQQNLKAVGFGVIVVKVPDNKIRSYRPLFSELLRAAEAVRPSGVIHIAHSKQN